MFKNNPISVFPDITEILFNSIDKKYLKVLLLNVLLIFSAILISLFTADYFNVFKEINSFTYLFYVVFIVVFILINLFLYAGFKQRKYAVRDKDISYKSGVFIRKLTTVPFSRIQHIEVNEGVFSRFFKLASLSVFTAGDSSDDLVIKGITKETALQIKEFISSKINE